MRAFQDQPSSFAKYTFMRDLQDNSETLFYSLIAYHVEELLPIVYTPAVGEGCQRFSEIWRKPRGLFISYPIRHLMDQMLADHRYDQIRCIVVSDGERILGLGDQGAGGMGIPIGKMALYTALGGIPPQHCLPILLDVGTDNEALLRNPIYIGWQHQRMRGQEYDDFIEASSAPSSAAGRTFFCSGKTLPARTRIRILDRYRDRLCTFNDDIQGTAAVTTGALFAAVNATGIPLRDQTIAMYGSGSAGVGIIALFIAAMQEQGLTESEARQRIYAFNRHGLMVEGDPNAALEPGRRLPGNGKTSPGGNSQDRARSRCSMWCAMPEITVLVGVSAQGGAFTEEIVREMTRHTPRPVILPLSNPTSVAEAMPADLLRWTDGRAIVGTGSPFAAGRDRRTKCPHLADQQFVHLSGPRARHPGVASKRVTDGMMMAAAKALASLSPTVHDSNCSAVAACGRLAQSGYGVAEWVARQAITEGVSEIDDPSSIADADPRLRLGSRLPSVRAHLPARWALPGESGLRNLINPAREILLLLFPRHRHINSQNPAFHSGIPRLMSPMQVKGNFTYGSLQDT